MLNGFYQYLALRVETQLGSRRGSAPVDSGVTAAQPATPPVLELPEKSLVVQTALSTNTPHDGLAWRDSGEPGAGNPHAGF